MHQQMINIGMVYLNIYLQDQDTIKQRHLAGDHWEAPGHEAEGLLSFPAGNRRSSETRLFLFFILDFCYSGVQAIERHTTLILGRIKFKRQPVRRFLS